LQLGQNWSQKANDALATAQVGDAIRTLRDDIPDLFTHDLNCRFAAGMVWSGLVF
jgi:hypothetical protein